MLQYEIENNYFNRLISPFNFRVKSTLMIKIQGKEPEDIKSIFNISTDSPCDIKQVT